MCIRDRRDDSVGIDDKALRSEEKLAVILGTEGDGLASQTIADCDYTVSYTHLDVYKRQDTGYR